MKLAESWAASKYIALPGIASAKRAERLIGYVSYEAGKQRETETHTKNPLMRCFTVSGRRPLVFTFMLTQRLARLCLNL